MAVIAQNCCILSHEAKGKVINSRLEKTRSISLEINTIWLWQERLVIDLDLQVLFKEMLIITHTKMDTNLILMQLHSSHEKLLPKL